MTTMTTTTKKKKTSSLLRLWLPVLGSLSVWTLLYLSGGIFKTEFAASSIASVTTTRPTQYTYNHSSTIEQKKENNHTTGNSATTDKLSLTERRSSPTNGNDINDSPSSSSSSFRIQNDKNNSYSIQSVRGAKHKDDTSVSSSSSSSSSSSFETTNATSTTSSTHTTTRSRTKIVAFSNGDYKHIAKDWYDELTALGYDEHMIVAQDDEAASFFAAQRPAMRWDEWNTKFATDCAPTFETLLTKKQVHQLYRRNLFASRWSYVLQQLVHEGYNVLLTDVDNVFVRKLPMQDLEASEYDAFFAYAGTVPSYPLDIFDKYGFTICGGMSWLRANSSVVDIARNVVETCKCQQGKGKSSCACHCDDQVVVNKLVLDHSNWWEDVDDIMTVATYGNDDGMGSNSTTTASIITTTQHLYDGKNRSMTWNGKSGVYDNENSGNNNRVKFKIWDRHTAYRARYDASCPDGHRSWVTMPTGWNRSSVRDMWRDTCGASTAGRTMTTES